MIAQDQKDEKIKTNITTLTVNVALRKSAIKEKSTDWLCDKIDSSIFSIFLFYFEKI